MAGIPSQAKHAFDDVIVAVERHMLAMVLDPTLVALADDQQDVESVGVRTGIVNGVGDGRQTVSRIFSMSDCITVETTSLFVM